MMTNEEYMRSPAGVVQELRGQYNAHIINSYAHLGNYDWENAVRITWDLLCQAIINEAATEKEVK